jgi:hypothetical protein
MVGTTHMTENIYQAYAESAQSTEPNNTEPPWVSPIKGPAIAPPAVTRCDPMAVGSALCSFVGFIPLITQVIGVTLGFLAIARMRRAKRSGSTIPGQRYALIGIAVNGTALLFWVAVLAGASTLFGSFSSVTDQLSKLIPGP